MDKREPRHTVSTAVAIEAGPHRERVGVARNLSATGMLFHSSSRFSVGEQVHLKFRMTPFKVSEGAVDAVVVRTELVPLQKSVLPFLTAVKFQQRLDEP